MADEPENTTPVVVPTPHKEGLFFRLMSMFGLTQHPTARDFETIADDEGAASNWWNKMFQLARDRKERYRIFDEMDSFGIIEGILDLYAEEVTQPDYDKQRTIWIESKSKDIISVGDECLRNIRIEDTAFPLIREACKYGDSFRRLIYASEKGVLGWQHVAPTRVDRVQDKFARLVGFKESGQKYRQKMRDVSWPWDYVHFRLLGKDEHTMYGSSLIEPVFRAWRQLCLAPSTLIWTTNGPVRADQLEVGMETYAHDPATRETRETPIVAVMKMGEQHLVRVRTAHRQITVTDNHGLLVQTADGQFTYKRAKDLIANGGVGRENWQGYRNADKLVLPALRFGELTHTVSVDPANYSVWLDEPARYDPEGVMARIRRCGLRTSAKNAHTFLRGYKPIAYSDYLKLAAEFKLPMARPYLTKSKQSAPFGVDFKYEAGSEFMRFFGFMLGDGWLRPNGIGFALGVRADQNERYIALCQKLFAKAGYTLTEAVEGVRGAAVAFHSHAIRDVFTSAGFITGFADKRIPDWMFGLAPELKREVIYGLMDADGGEQAEQGWRLTLANKALVEQVWTLCQQAGFRVSREIAELARDGKQLAYRIWVSKAPHDDDVTYEAVTHVDDAGFDQTYDITVEDGQHNFVADGVVSHNTLSEDAVLLYRLRRAPDRNVVFVDVGNMEEHDAINYLNQWRKRFRKHEFIDPASSEYKKQYNPLTPIEDIFFPVRGDTGHSRIENLSGAANAGDIADLEHFRNALFGAARVPKAYMGFEGEINAKATLSQQDVRFARGCKRVRRTLLYGLRTTLDVHFALHSGADAKFDVEREGNEYVVQSSPISYLDEWERLELVQLRYQIVDAMSTLAANLQLDVKAWATYILTDYAKLPDSMVAKLMSKTAPEKAESDGLSSRERKQILETHGMAGLKAVTSDMGPKGYVQLSEDEKRAIGRAIHRHAGLRKVISDLVEYHADDFEDMSIREAQLRQRDSALLPPTVLGKLMDDVADDQSATQLQEDLKAIRTQTPLNERKGDNHASTDATVERKA